MADTGSTQQGAVGADGGFAAAKLGATGGRGQVTFDGSSTTSETVTIAHGLGYTPESVVANAFKDDSPSPFITLSFPFAVATGHYTETTFDACVEDTNGIPPAGQTVRFNWIAI